MPAPRHRPFLIDALEPRKLLANVAVAINPATTYQTIDAIGGAANSGFQRPEYRQASYFNQVFGDLGISAVRSPLDPGWELTNDNKDPNTINWAGFNDGAIANTMEFFKQAQARGVKTFLLSVWSPSSWMKTNRANTNGGQLKIDDREEFGEYVTAALLRARDKWGVTITQVSIGNEPDFTEKYPSTFWTPDEMAATIKVVARHIKAAGLTTQIVAPEDVSSLYRSTTYANAIHADPEADADVPILGTHYLNDADTNTFSNAAKAMNKKLWFTEAGDGNADLSSALGLARSIDSALGRYNVSAWFNWQISGDTPYEDLMNGSTPNIKYYALKQFAHFVKPGDVNVSAKYGSPSDSVRISAFKDPKTGNLTVVMSNDSTTDATVNLSLSGTTLPKSYEQFRTSATENCVQLANVAGGAKSSVAVPANSIVTLYSGPDAAPLTNTTAAPTVPTPQYADAWQTTPLRTAAEDGDLTTVQKLVAGGVDVNAAFSNGWTALFVAASSPYNGADQTVSYLLAHGADVTHRDVDGLTALHVAAMNEVPAYGTAITVSPNRVTALLKAGIGVNSRDNYGRTPLMYAAMYPAEGPDLNPATAKPDVLIALLAAGADPTLKDVYGKTAMDYAKQEKAVVAVAALSDPGNIQTDVFKDTNANGVHDAGEVALANVRVYIDLNQNDVLDAAEPTAVTDAKGVATFTKLWIGTYVVRAAAPDASYTPPEVTAMVPVTSDTTTVAPFAFVPPAPPPVGTAVLSGYVVNDANRNGIWDGGEKGIAGRTVFLDRNGNGTLDAGETSQVTASNGKYAFTGLTAGTYRILEVVPAGSTQTKPTTAAYTTTIKNGTTTSGRDFTVYAAAVTPTPPNPPATGNGTASIHAYVVNDANEDGKWGSGEKGLTGRTVWIDADNDGVLDPGETTAKTGANGVFDFKNLAAGTYHIRQVLPAGWKQTSPTMNGPLTITLTTGQAKSGSSLLTATA